LNFAAFMPGAEMETEWLPLWSCTESDRESPIDISTWRWFRISIETVRSRRFRNLIIERDFSVPSPVFEGPLIRIWPVVAIFDVSSVEGGGVMTTVS